MEAVFALLPAILLLAICIVSIVITRRFGLSPIVGYLLGALLIGEHAFGFTAASVDGFQVTFGDLSDLRMANTMSIDQRASIVITDVRMERAKEVMPVVRERFPNLMRFTSVANEDAAAELDKLGMHPVVEQGEIPGLSMVSQILKSQGIADQEIEDWLAKRRRDVERQREPAVA